MLTKGLWMGAAVAALLGFGVGGVKAESLKAALASAYANNPTISSALMSVKVAAENIALSKSAVLPSVGASVSTTGSFTSIPGATSTSESTSAGLSYSQTLFDNNKTNAKVEQARALVQVANQTLRQAEQTVLLSVVTAYMNVILNTQLMQLRNDSVSFYQSQVKAAQDRLRIGEGTKIDVAQAQAALASAVAGYKSAVASLQTAQASYTHWVGHKPKNLSADYNYGTLIPVSVDKAISLADALNPSILGAKAAIRAAQAGVDAANAAFGPTVGVVGQIGPTFSGCQPACSTPSSAFSGSLKLSLSVPLYEGGALGAGTRQANLSQIKSDLDAQAARDQVNEAVITSWSTLQNAAAQIDSARSGVDAGQAALDGVIQERDVGQKTTLDVLNAESTLTTSKEALISATSGRVVAAFSLIAATGRLSSKDLGLGVATKSAEPYAAKVEDAWGELRSLQ
jgi:outer membrane protein